MTEKSGNVRNFNSQQLIPIGTAIIAILFIWLGLSKYGFWDEFKGPLPGFFPVVIATAMLFASGLAFVFSFKEKAPIWNAANWLVVLSVALIFGTTFLIGLIPSIAIYVLVWLRWYEKVNWKPTLITFAIIMGIVIGVFILWLGVPFPKGLIFNALFN